MTDVIIPPAFANLPPHVAAVAAIVDSAVTSRQTVPPLPVDIDTITMLAICEEESGCGLELTPPGPTGTGDDGHGRGYFQFDDRPHPNSYVDADGLTNDQWISTYPEKWQDPVESANRAVDQMRWSIGQLLGSCADPSWALYAAICSYNAGIDHTKKVLATLQEGASLDTVKAALDVVTAPPHKYVSQVDAKRIAFSQAS